MATNYLLSKSSFIRSVQCQKHIFLYKNFFNLKDPIPKDKQVIFNRGINVGLLAQQLFPGGTDVSPDSIKKFNESVTKTAELINKGEKIIYEAAFIFNEVLVALDILVKEGDKWFAYEVKSSVKITSAYILDASLQYYVIKNCLPQLEDFGLVTINNDYTLKGNLDVHGLFKITSLNKDVTANLPFIETKINEAKNTLSKGDIPNVKIGEHCYRPYKCDYYNTCWKSLPNRNVFELSGSSLNQQLNWYNNNQKEISAISDTNDLSRVLKIQIEAIKHNTVYLERDKIEALLSKIHYPIMFFDIEQVSSAIPIYEGTKPYQQIPFLFATHTLHENGELTDDYFFAEPGKDPRKDFLDAILQKLGTAVSIAVFDANLETSILSSLANEFPETRNEIERIIKKIVDISGPFSNYQYFNPKSLGSTSLKHLYTTLFNDDVFTKLDINSGATANYGYIEMAETNDIFRKEEIKLQLINYCKTDTFATHKLFTLLKEAIN